MLLNVERRYEGKKLILHTSSVQDGVFVKCNQRMVVSTFIFSRFASLTTTSSTIENSENFKVVAINQAPSNSIKFAQDAVMWAQQNSLPFFLLCSNQTNLNSKFSYTKLLTTIEFAKKKKSDILVYSATKTDSIIPTGRRSLYWTNLVLGVSCMVVFAQAYNHILSLPPYWDEAHLEFTCVLTQGLSRKMLFSYRMFDEGEDLEFLTRKWGKSLSNNHLTQNKIPSPLSFSYPPATLNYEKFSVPVYIINLKGRNDRLEHIKKEFQDKSEFEVNIFPACKDKCGALGLWLSIRTIVSEAKRKEEDIIIICEDDHVFTKNYSKEYLFQQISIGYSIGADYINGGIADFENAIMVSDHLFRADMLRCTQFIILYRDFYDKILSAEYNELVLPDVLLSRISNNKMLIYPFISTQKDFGYSDVTSIFNQNDGKIETMFTEAARRVENIRKLTLESRRYI